jgi:phage pi2 protein 07
MDALTEISGTQLEHPSYSSNLAPSDFWAFPTMKRELQGQNRLFHYPPEACDKWSAARFREVGGAL